MFGPMGSNIISILRVLTPGEIDRYADQVSQEAQVVGKVAAGAEGYDLLSQGENESSFEPTKQKEQSSEDTPAEEHRAKIIPINSSVELEQEPVEEVKTLEQQVHMPAHLSGQGQSELESIGLKSAGALREEQRLRKEKEDKEKDSTTVFILDQRDKLRKSKDKLAGQAAILEYRKSASQEINLKLEEEQDEEDGVKVSGSSGILINKKHY